MIDFNQVTNEIISNTDENIEKNEAKIEANNENVTHIKPIKDNEFQGLNIEKTTLEEIIDTILVNAENQNLIDFLGGIYGEKVISYKKDGSKQIIKLKYYRTGATKFLIHLMQQENIRIIKDGEKLYFYNNCYWEKIENDKFILFLKDFSLKVGIFELEIDDEYLKKMYKDILNYIPSYETKRQNLINLKNGTFNLDTLKLQPFNPDDYLFYQLDFNFEPNAVNNTFMKYLETTIPDKDTRQTLQEALGGIFIKNNTIKLEYSLFFNGSGSNGKSTLLDIIEVLLGDENISRVPLSRLKEEYYIMRLQHKLVNISPENNMTNFDKDIFKMTSSQEPLLGRDPREKPQEINDYGRFIYAVNELKLSDYENTYGFWRRFIIIPFEVEFDEHTKDPEMFNKILNDGLSGVFNWILEGAKRILSRDKKNIFISEKCNLEVKKLQRDTDPVIQFIYDEGYKKSKTTLIKVSDLYNEFRNYCVSVGIHTKITRKDFSKRLISLGFKKHISNYYYFFIEKQANN